MGAFDEVTTSSFNLFGANKIKIINNRKMRKMACHQGKELLQHRVKCHLILLLNKYCYNFLILAYLGFLLSTNSVITYYEGFQLSLRGR